jgi:hypothetical protein
LFLVEGTRADAEFSSNVAAVHKRNEVGCAACHVRTCAINSENRFCTLVQRIHGAWAFIDSLCPHKDEKTNYLLSSFFDAWLEHI